MHAGVMGPVIVHALNWGPPAAAADCQGRLEEAAGPGLGLAAGQRGKQGAPGLQGLGLAAGPAAGLLGRQEETGLAGQLERLAKEEETGSAPDPAAAAAVAVPGHWLEMLEGTGSDHSEAGQQERLEQTGLESAAEVLAYQLKGSPPEHPGHRQGTPSWRPLLRPGRCHQTSEPCRQPRQQPWRSR